MAGGGPFGAAASSPARSLHHLPHLPCALRAAHFPSKALLPPGYAQVGRRDCLRMRIASWPSLVNPKSQSPLIHRHLFVNHARGGYGHENMRGTGAPCQCIVQNSTFVACAAKIYTGSGFTSTNGQVLFDRTRMLAPQFVPFAKSGSSDSLPAVAADDIVEDDDHPHAWNLPLSHTLPLIQPFLLSQWQLIMRAWACTVVSVVALFLFIPQTGQLSDLVGKGDLPNLARKCMLMAALLAIRSMAQFYQQSLLWEVALRVTYEIRCHVFKRLLRNDLEYFESRDGVPAGDIVFRITSEAEDTGDSVYSFLETLIPSTLQLVAMSIRMILLSPLLSVVTILVVPSMSVVVAVLGERLRTISREGQNSIADLSSYLNETFPAMFIVKAYAAEEFEQSHFERLALADCEARMMKKKMKAFIPQVIAAVYATTATVLFGIATWAISCGSFDGASMISFATSLVLLVDPIQAVGKSYNELKQGEPAIERLFELTTTCENVVQKGGTLLLPHVPGDVKFSGVSFRYNEYSPNVLMNVSLHAHAGETIALVGHSGSGKSTVGKLLLRLYDPTEGCILIDGHDIRGMNVKSLRQHIAIVPQEVVLLTGTVAENIAYGKLVNEHDMKKVKQAALLPNAHDFIIKLPNQYNTEMRDHASCLSGGQRQRLSIARAIYKQPSILILDEATSALDNISEQLVREALEKLMVGRTVLVIAHRLETIQKADRIFLLDEGRVVEEGTHLSLLAQGGRYASLYEFK